MAAADPFDQCLINENKIVEKHTEERIQLDHRLDSLILLVYVILLVLSVLTIWTFKHRRFRFFHETGLSVIYGFIVGIALRYLMKPSEVSVEYHDFPRPVNASCGGRLPPEKMIVRLPLQNSNLSMSFQYGFDQLTVRDIPSNNKATFNPEIFFNVLLPPIIFTAGYSMKRSNFFNNLGAILTYAVFGTLLSALATGIICYGFTRGISDLSKLLSFADCLLFGSIISATDPVTVLTIFTDLKVDVTLYALVFGESVLNDALAIALSQSVEQYGSLSAGIFDTHAFMYSVSHFLVMFGVSFAIGVIVGFLTALLTKFTHIRDYPTLETALFILMSYSTFLLAETVGFTGIVAVLFCGIIQAHYTYNNLSEESKVWTREFFEILNFLSENFVFAYIGVSTFTFQQHYWDVRFVLIALFACIVARAVNVYPLSAIINLCRSYGKSCKSDCFRGRSRARQSAETQSSVVDANSGQSSGYDVLKDSYRPSSDQDDESTKMFTADIPWNVQHMLFYSGLRGAMAFSLAIRNTSSTTRQMFFSTTIVVVMITVIIFGGLSTTMLAWLKIRVGVNSPQATEGSSYHDDNVLRPPRRHLGCCAYCWYRLDRQYIMPLFTNRGPPLTESVPWCCYPIAKLLTTTQQLNQPLDEQSSRPETRGDSPAVLILHDRNVGVKLDSESALDPKSYQTRELKAHDDSSADLSDVLNHAHPDPLDSTKVQGRFIHQDIA